MQLNSLYKEGLLVANKGFHKLLPAKIICIGDCSVGKTSIICRFIKDSFKHLNQSTLGVEYFQKVLSIDNDKILLEIWDTAGQERYRSLIKFFYKNAQGALLVFDLCNKDTFKNLEFWLKSIKTNSDKELVIFVVGNKCDKLEKIVINSEEIKGFCEENGLMYFETSAKENIRINELFYELARKINKQFNFCDNSFQNSDNSDEFKEEKGCSICKC